jgi:UDP-glucose 4-epimerase
MKVLVTGGSGFIGSHVVDKLKDKGAEVRVYDMVIPTFRDDIEYYQGSLLDRTALGMAMEGIDIVFHLGAIADVKEVYENPIYSESINTRGTINVLEASKNGGVLKLVYGSTIWVYSDTDKEFVDESAPLHAPSHLYTATKIASEYYCQTYFKLYGLKTTILRYGIPYGPRARSRAVIPVFVRKALDNEPLTIAGDGSQFRNFVYVEDLAEGNVLGACKIADNKIYNLEGDVKISIKDIAETIKKILGDVKIEYIEGRPRDFSGKEISNKKAEEELGWKPKMCFEDGVKKYIDWYQEQLRQKNTNTIYV